MYVSPTWWKLSTKLRNFSNQWGKGDRLWWLFNALYIFCVNLVLTDGSYNKSFEKEGEHSNDLSFWKDLTISRSQSTLQTQGGLNCIRARAVSKPRSRTKSTADARMPASYICPSGALNIGALFFFSWCKNLYAESLNF